MEIEDMPPLGGGLDAARFIAIARGWIGTPYVHQASLKGVGCDCLGLLRGVFRTYRGAEPEEIPPYDPGWDIGGEDLYNGFKRHFTEISPAAAMPGDVLLFRMVPQGPARHCGLLAEKDGQRTLIHARQNKRVSEEPFTAFWQKKRAYGFCILADLEDRV